MYQKLGDESGCNVFAYQYCGYPGTSCVQLGGHVEQMLSTGGTGGGTG